MIKTIDHETKERVNKAIANIRYVATRAKRASILDATQRAETVVTLLNDFRQYINVHEYRSDWAGVKTPFKHDVETLQRVVQATFQADSVYALLTRTNKKKYEQEYRQVWNLLENIHAYLDRRILEGGRDAKITQ
jgi:DNA-binding LacI/PurR family transcriptional regulator